MLVRPPVALGQDHSHVLQRSADLSRSPCHSQRSFPAGICCSCCTLLESIMHEQVPDAAAQSHSPCTQAICRHHDAPYLAFKQVQHATGPQEIMEGLFARMHVNRSALGLADGACHMFTLSQDTVHDTVCMHPGVTWTVSNQCMERLLWMEVKAAATSKSLTDPHELWPGVFAARGRVAQASLRGIPLERCAAYSLTD